MSNTALTRQRPSFWARLAILLGLVAVFSALVAPVSMLAKEVRTGKLGGICAVNTAAFVAADAARSTDSGAAQAGSHCELCGSLGLALLPLPFADVPRLASSAVLAFKVPAGFSAAVSGLPFSRGPPVVLT